MLQPEAIHAAVRNVLRQISRSRAALTAVIFGVVAMILAAGFVDWNLRFGRDNTIQSQLGHIQLVRPGFLQNGRADPYAYLVTPPEQSTLEVLPGFQRSEARLLLAGLASSGESTLSFIGEGIDTIAADTKSSGLRFPEGRNLLPGETRTAIVGRGLAQNLGLSIGDPLVLIVNTQSGGISAAEVKVVGFFQSISQAYDDTALRVPIKLAQELMRTDGEHLRLIFLNDITAVPAALEQLRHKLPADKYEAAPWYELADFYNKTAALFKKQVSVIYLIIAVIIILAISNTMIMAVMGRVGEIGTMMAFGVRRTDILSMFLLEGFILGLVGSSGGIALGCALAAAISTIGIPMPPGPGMSWGYEAGILLSPTNIFSAFWIALSTTLLASVFPAWRASRFEIVDALRTRQ